MKVTAAQLGVDAESATVRWRVEQRSDGKRTLLIGAVDRIPISATAIRYADYRESPATRSAATSGPATAASWVCYTTTDGTTLVGGYLDSGYSTWCSGVRPGLMRHRYRFERDSWSGWRRYTDDRYSSSWTGSQTQSGDSYAWCGLGRPGTYNYRHWVTLEIDPPPGFQSPAITSSTVRSACGTGVS